MLWWCFVLLVVVLLGRGGSSLRPAAGTQQFASKCWSRSPKAGSVCCFRFRPTLGCLVLRAGVGALTEKGMEEFTVGLILRLCYSDYFVRARGAEIEARLVSSARPAGKPRNYLCGSLGRSLEGLNVGGNPLLWDSGVSRKWYLYLSLSK